MYLNRAQISGNAGDAAVIRDLQSGEKVATFSVATTNKWKDKSGVEQKETVWHRIIAWGFNVQIATQIKKGSRVYVEGRIQHRKWTDQQGQERTTTEIVAYRMDVNPPRRQDEPDLSGYEPVEAPSE